jgi:16S rRNA (uracil1498-N3)-methyltransferase
MGLFDPQENWRRVGDLRRFFVEEIRAQENLYAIKGAEARHITRVLRMGSGDRFVLMDGKGGRFQALIESAGPREVTVILEKALPKPPGSPVDIVLCQAVLRSNPMDSLIRKTSELGVNRIFPFTSQRTVVQMREDRAANKQSHWRQIARSAAKQSDREAPAEIRPLCTLGELTSLITRKQALKVVLWEAEGARDLKGILRAASRENAFIGMVGPEGGFSREEIKVARDAGFVSASMGHRILRAETAAVAMVAIVQYEWGDLSIPKS